MASDDPRAAASDWRGHTNYISRPNITWYGEDTTQYAPAVNVSKILQLYVGPMKDRKDIRGMTAWADNGGPECWDNWVYQKVNGITNCSPVVYLKSDNMQFNIEVNNKFTSMSVQGVLDKMGGNLKGTGTETIINALNGGLEFLNDFKNSQNLGENYKDYMGALYIPKYANVQAWEGMNPIKFTFPTFNFSFGQYGLYNARREVVEPIMAICSCFLPTQESEKNTYRWQGPIATPNAQLITTLKFLAATAGEAGARFAANFKEAIDNMSIGESSTSESENDNKEENKKNDGFFGAVENAIDTAIQIKDGIYAAFDKANEQLLKAKGNKLAYFRLGKGKNAAVMGPFYVQGVKPSFNFKNTDMYGYPTSGSITFEGTITPLIGNHVDMDIFGLHDEADAVPMVSSSNSGPAVTK